LEIYYAFIKFMFILKGFVVGHLGPSINFVLVYVSELETQEGASFRISLFILWCFFSPYTLPSSWHLPKNDNSKESEGERRSIKRRAGVGARYA
jgi:hypothetical protein